MTEITISDKMTTMDVREIRAANLKALADKEGGHAALARKLGVSRPTISKRIGKAPSSYIGHNMARDIESTFGLAPFYLDTLHGDIESDTEPTVVSRRLPVVAMFDAPRYKADPVHFDPEHVTSRLNSPSEHTSAAFAVRLDDESMQPDMQKGDFLFIEPHLKPKIGQVALLEVNGQFGVRYLANNFGTWIGKPSNPSFPSIEIPKETNIVGICIALARHLDFQ